MGTFSIWHWLIVLAVVILVFGTKKLPNLGQDLGNALRGFKKAVTNEEEPAKLKADANTVDNASTADTANTANTADSHKVDPKKDRVP